MPGFFCRILNRDTVPNRIPSLRMPTMGVYVPNMYLTQSNTNGNVSNNDNPHVLVRDLWMNKRIK